MANDVTLKAREIVARLRDAANGMDNLKSSQGDYGLCDDAADLIEALSKDAEVTMVERLGAEVERWKRKTYDVSVERSRFQDAREDLLAALEWAEASDPQIIGQIRERARAMQQAREAGRR